MPEDGNKLRLYLAEDHAIVREGIMLILSTVPDLEVIGGSGDGREALEQIEALKPDLVILDISLPSMTGIEITHSLRRYHPQIKIVILSRHDNHEYLDQLMKEGIHGYVLKDDAGDDLVRAIQAVRKGETYLSPRIATRLVSGLRNQGKSNDGQLATGQFTLLSNREREVLKLIAEGLTNEEIGKKLWISGKTVKVHRQNIMKKLDIHRVADLVKYAIKSGIVEA